MKNDNAVMTIDPVCGMEVDPQQTRLKNQYGGNTYYFCSEECQITFERRPDKYSRTAKAA